jgi:hypothetical protein
MPFAYPNLLADVFDKLTQIKSKAQQANKRPEHLTWLQNENVFLREALESLMHLIDEVTGRDLSPSLYVSLSHSLSSLSLLNHTHSTPTHKHTNTGLGLMGHFSAPTGRS